MEGLFIVVIVRINEKLYNEVNSMQGRCANVSAYCKYPVNTTVQRTRG
ncbi:hypothetical protein BACI71_90373 [Bacillus mycoides]|uniref:Uncharacterized protein n=1 Tax=Bacillus mycoides TaxID=1405 RepID=A0A654CDA1_BACMY|nr:hypothetical protein BACI71_90373 [Bacillus mycoides]